MVDPKPSAAAPSPHPRPLPTPSSLEPDARSSRRRPPDPRLLVGLPLLSPVIPLPDGWIPSPRWRHPLPVVSPASSPSPSSRSRASCSSESLTRTLEQLGISKRAWSRPVHARLDDDAESNARLSARAPTAQPLSLSAPSARSTHA